MQTVSSDKPSTVKFLAELAKFEIAAAKLSLPVAIGVHLVDHDRAMFSSMPRKISLPVSIDVQSPDHPAAFDRLFPDRGANRLSLPFEVARKADVD